MTPILPSSPRVTYPLANDQLDAVVSSMSSWLLQNSARLTVQRWFLFTNYGFPDRYAHVYAGLTLLDGPGAEAQLTRCGGTYARLAGAAGTTSSTTC